VRASESSSAGQPRGVEGSRALDIFFRLALPLLPKSYSYMGEASGRQSPHRAEESERPVPAPSCPPASFCTLHVSHGCVRTRPPARPPEKDRAREREREKARAKNVAVMPDSLLSSSFLFSRERLSQDTSARGYFFFAFSFVSFFTSSSFSSSSSSCVSFTSRCSPWRDSSRLTSPHLTSPHLTSPHLTAPRLTSPHRPSEFFTHETFACTPESVAPSPRQISSWNFVLVRRRRAIQVRLDRSPRRLLISRKYIGACRERWPPPAASSPDSLKR
jgi:hypothetical protein